MATDGQGSLFSDDPAGGVVAINDLCRVRTEDGQRVVLVGGMPIAHYGLGDRAAEAYAMVLLVEEGWARQLEVARGFAVSSRTVRRQQQRFDEGGLGALGRAPGYPSGRPRLPQRRSRRIAELRAAGVPQREIARRLGVTDGAVRKVLHRLGFKPPAPVQAELPLGASPATGAPSADSNLSGLAAPPVEAALPTSAPLADPNVSDPPAPPVEVALPTSAPLADPNVSDPAAPPVELATDAASPDEPLPVTLDTDPLDRTVDRMLARLGLIDDAAPLFADAVRLPGAGVLLALPSLVASGIFQLAPRVYGSLGPAFYGLRSTLLSLLLMALLRIKRPEALKEHSPEELGRLLGMDRIAEVKTLRRKLRRLAATGKAVELGRLLAHRRVERRGSSLGFLYVDGHVRVYHGKRPIQKTHSARVRIALPATTDYWVNDVRGDPLFVVTAVANAGLVKMLPALLAQAREIVGERRITVVFDRGGWSPRLFATLVAAGFDILTYRKGRHPRVPARSFSTCEATVEGNHVRYVLADQRISLLGGRLRLRQVTRLKDDHQTPIVTSRLDLSAAEVAFRMFERWQQENFFKYLREEYALDALVDYDVEPDDAGREVPNPKWHALDAQLKAARQRIAEAARTVGAQVTLDLILQVRRRGSPLSREIASELGKALVDVFDLERRRAAVPQRIPVGERDPVVVKLSTERKHLTNVLKIVAYQAESELVDLVAPHYRRADDEGRTLVRTALKTSADLRVTDGELRITLAPLSSAHRTRAVAALCAALNEHPVCFPDTHLRLRYAVAAPA